VELGREGRHLVAPPEEIYAPLLHGKDFETVLQETVDEVLNQIFGYQTTDTIFESMKMMGSEKGMNTPEPPMETALPRLLKRLVGAPHVLIETSILKCLHFKYGLEYEDMESSSFRIRIRKLKKDLSRKSSGGVNRS